MESGKCKWDKCARADKPNKLNNYIKSDKLNQLNKFGRHEIFAFQGY